MKAITFFSGIDSFGLGLRAAGFEIIGQVEYDSFAQDILRKRWQFFAQKPPKVYGDIRQINAEDLPKEADLFIGGFPCQPFSLAGYRKGADDDRNMWPDFYRIIADYKPRWLILENVSAINVSKDGEPAYTITVLNDLARSGYNASWYYIPASDCGLQHERKRWWCVATLANPDSDGLQRPNSDTKKANIETEQQLHKAHSSGTHVVYANNSRKQTAINTGRTRQKSTPRRKPIITNCNTNARNTGRLQHRQKRKPEYRLDAISYGLTAWMDQPAPVAGRGEPQFNHEPTRLVHGHPEQWGKQMHTIGNSGVPQIPYNLGKYIIKFESE